MAAIFPMDDTASISSDEDTATTATNELPSVNSEYVVNMFKQKIREQESWHEASCAAAVLTQLIRESKCKTTHGLQEELKAAHRAMVASAKNHLATNGACEIYQNYVQKIVDSGQDFAAMLQALISGGLLFEEFCTKSTAKIATSHARFIRDGATVLIHGDATVVPLVLNEAHKAGKQFSVLVTEGLPSQSGVRLAKQLQVYGLPVEIIQDSTVAHRMEQVDMILCGADAVVESGGIISQIGTYQIALVAHALSKPFYVAAEVFKFARIYPLTQRDIPPQCQVASRVDYTPPHLITLLFTDTGVLTPSAVSDELIRFYN
eukprot:TRINITY_DN1815_c0_g1_i1.p1 TRINITY_DN1815_c0_g1~~TRINITY_DN1815_c0_g1_i1.p1  ORF type:complete len:349 (+),score=62.71 TRINITY_DN1815_c0_g1_i1:93-1049(+)